VLISIISSGQRSSDFVSLDKSTYDYYLKKDWKNLIVYGKWGLQNGIDYYYLRMRIGVAYYEQESYRQAIAHFRKALEFNTKDVIALEYLYYAYLFSGRDTDARLIADEFPASLKNRLSLTGKPKTLSLSVSNTYRWNPSYNSSVSSFSLPLEIISDGWQLIEKNLDYFNFRFVHQLSNKITLHHGYGYLSRMRYLVILNDLSLNSFSNDRFHQYQVFLSGNFSLATNFSVGLSVHYLNLRPKIYIDPSYGGGPPSNNYYSSVSPENNWVGYLSGNLELGLFTIHGGVGYSYLNHLNQFQKDFAFSFYPLGNLNLYSTSTLSHQSNFYQLDLYNNHFIFSQTLGFRIFDPLWMEINGSLGEISNFYSFDGTVIYNDMNPIKYKAGINLILPLNNKNTVFSILYNYMELQSRFFSQDGEPVDINNAINYNIHSITGGIKWNISRK